MRRPLKLQVQFKKMGAQKIERTMDHLRDIKKSAEKKNDSIQFHFNSFFPINDLGILKVTSRLGTNQQQVTKNTDCNLQLTV